LPLIANLTESLRLLAWAPPVATLTRVVLAGTPGAAEALKASPVAAGTTRRPASRTCVVTGRRFTVTTPKIENPAECLGTSGSPQIPDDHRNPDRP